jgi:hypothetical protein
MEEIKFGKILSFEGSWNSGIAYLVVKTENRIEVIPADSGCLGRALVDAFGSEVYGKGHSVNNEAIYGKKIFYGLTRWGTLEGFTPLEEASAELISEYKRQQQLKKLKEKNNAIVAANQPQWQ